MTKEQELKKEIKRLCDRLGWNYNKFMEEETNPEEVEEEMVIEKKAELKGFQAGKQQALEEVKKKIDEWVISNKTSWKWLEERGLRNAKKEGDCIFLNYLDEFDAIEELKQSLDEKEKVQE